ncbi:MAG: TatD family hydrolase [Dysgonamonadaceae bacterium]
MDIYDIHTYNLLPDDSDDPYHSYVLNVFPLGFEDAVGTIKKCFFTCGIHPWHSEDAEAQLAFLEEIAAHPLIVAIGEAGLDKLKGPELDVQKVVFERHIRLSEKLQKPLIVHCVKAWDELIALQKEYRPSQPWIIHGFRGKPELTKQLVHLGFYFTIGERFNEEGIRMIPLHRMFCETDESEIPILEIYKSVAASLDIDPEDLAGSIENNVKRFFPGIVSSLISEQKDSI